MHFTINGYLDAAKDLGFIEQSKRGVKGNNGRIDSWWGISTYRKIVGLSHQKSKVGKDHSSAQSSRMNIEGRHLRASHLSVFTTFSNCQIGNFHIVLQKLMFLYCLGSYAWRSSIFCFFSIKYCLNLTCTLSFTSKTKW